MKPFLALSFLWVGALCQEFNPTPTQKTTSLAGARLTASSSQCQALLADCKPTEASCASQLCQSCTNLGVTPSVEPCCRAKEPHLCFAGKSPTPLFTTNVDTSGLACSSLVAVSSACASSTKGWRDLEFGSQASCACYISGKPQASVFDAYYSTCFAWLKTKNPDQYSMFGPSGGRDAVMTPCGDFIASPSKYATMTAPPTAASTAASATNASGAASASAQTTTSQGSGATAALQLDRFFLMIMASAAFLYSFMA